MVRTHPSEVRRCGHCRQPMQCLGLAAHYQQTVEIDVCEQCSLIWFDATESARLAGPGIADLIRLIHSAVRHSRSLQPLPVALPCPICASELQLVANQSRFGRTAQLQCPSGHGAYQSVSLFLAEKGYFRPYAWSDIRTLAAAGQHIKCTACGATLESRPHDTCPYCRSPVGVLDAARLASAIDIRQARDGSAALAIVGEQATCPSCGNGIDLTHDLLCPNCRCVVSAEKTQDAIAAVTAVEARVRANHERQLPEVSKRLSEEGAALERTDLYAPERGENWRRGLAVASAVLTLSMAAYVAIGRGAPKNVIVFNDDGSKTAMTAAEANAIDARRRAAEMAKVVHAPAGLVPPQIEITESADAGRRLSITSTHPRRMTVRVGLAREQFQDSWLHCDMLPVEGGDRAVLFPETGAIRNYVPSARCNEKMLQQGKYEFTIYDVDRLSYEYRSDSTFFD